MCLEIYELDPVKFILALGLTWRVTLTKTQVELDFKTDIDMLLMIDKGIRGEIYNVINHYAKAKEVYERL